MINRGIVFQVFLFAGILVCPEYLAARSRSRHNIVTTSHSEGFRTPPIFFRITKRPGCVQLSSRYSWLNNARCAAAERGVCGPGDLASTAAVDQWLDDASTAAQLFRFSADRD